MSLVAHPRSTFAFCLAAGLLAASTFADSATDWPRFRGPGNGGPSLAGSLPSPAGFEVAWQQPLGSGYSGLVAQDGKVIALFTSGSDDVMAALDGTSGKELWRVRLGEKYAGHDGSDDGPISTPAIEGEVVYVLTPRGVLLASSLADGKELWRVQLDDKMAKTPFYGFTASPLLVGDLLVMPTGGDLHAVSAFDKKSGQLRWTSESGSASYQSASLLKLAGQEQIVAIADQWVAGFVPESGKTLWKYEFSSGNDRSESAHITPADEKTLLINLNAATVVLEISRQGESLSAKEAFRSQAFTNTLALPVYHDGAFYGFTGRFLTALDAQSGKILWRSRPPGGSTLSLVDGKLAILDSEGNFVLAEANTKEYRELARVKALSAGNYSAPAFAGGTFFVRNLSEIAALRPSTSAVAATGRPKPAKQELRGEFGKFLAKVNAASADEKQKMVDAYFAQVTSTPIIEEGLAHFVYRGEAENVGVAGTFLTQNQDDQLERVAGTDLFFRSEELDNEGIWTYNLLVNYSDPQVDPSNPVIIPDVFNEASELRMPKAPATPFLAAPAEGTAKGKLDSFLWQSDALKNSRRISVYLPAGYEGSETRYPVLVVNHGDQALRSGLYANTLDNLIAEKKIEKVIALFVPRGFGREYGGPQTADYVKLLTQELLPHLDKHYRTDPARRAAMGVGSAGLVSAYAALSVPGLFQHVAVQSFYLNDGMREELLGLAEKEGKTSFVVEWSRHDYKAPSDAEADSKLLVAKLEASGHQVVTLVTAGEPAWGRWRAQSGALLAALFPPTP